MVSAILRNVILSKRLALFDFDGTITNKDTLIDFIIYTHGFTSFIFGFTLMLPYLIGYKLKIIPNYRAKERVLEYFYKGLELQELERQGREYVKTKLPPLLRASAMAKIEEHKSAGDRVVVISASSDIWIKEFIAQNNIEIIATRLEVIDGVLSGKIDGKNCFGLEKVNRLKEYLDVTEYEEIIAYGDSSGDKEMLSFATKGFYRVV